MAVKADVTVESKPKAKKTTTKKPAKVTLTQEVKVSDLTTEQKNEIAKEYLQSPPTREEVANFLQGIINEQVTPEIIKQINKANVLNSVTFLAINQLLVDKGLVAPEDLANTVKKLVDEVVRQEKEAAQKVKAEEEKAKAKTKAEETKAEEEPVAISMVPANGGVV